MSRDPDEVWSPEYDSTWEEEGEERPRGQREPGNRRQPTNCRKWMSRAARDLQNYRHSYVNDKNYQRYMSQPQQTPNLDFYQNRRPFEPEGLTIMQLFDRWKEEYEILERNHSYIQWLFPLREYGMNSCAKPLSKVEIELMKENVDVRKRFLDAYKLMLDFYGIQLENEETGKVTRAENWVERFKNLNDHSHNNLRITRILKCLGELGFEHYQAPLVKFFLTETLCNDELQNVKRSALDYFMFTVKDKEERRKLVHFAWNNYKSNKFIWGPVEKLRAYQPPVENEQQTRNCQKEKNDESDKEGKINGQLDSFESYSSKEGIKNYSDSLASKNVECQQDSKPDKKPNDVCIPLNYRVRSKESHEIVPKKGSGRCSEGMSENNGLFFSSSHNVNGLQCSTEDVDHKSYGEEGNLVSSEVLPKHDHKVPSPLENREEGNVEEHVMDGTVSRHQNETLQQDNLHKKIDNLLTETQRKRKNVPFDGEGMSDGGPPHSDDISGLPKEGGEEKRVAGVRDKVKKLKLSEQPDSETNQKLLEDAPSSIATRDSQQSGDGPDLSQERGKCSPMNTEESKEKMPKLHKQSKSEDRGTEEDDPSTSSTSGDLK